MEASAPDVSKKLWNIVRIVYFMLKTGIPKSKIMVDDLHFMLKKGKYNAGKAISNLVSNHKLVHNSNHFSSLSCRSSDSHLSFISPTEYEFSCSNSPAFYPFNYSHHKRNKHHNHHFYNNKSSRHHNRYDDNVTTMAALQKVLEMLNSHEAAAAAASPMVVLPGFGRSPIGRQLRVTDSPFPLKDEGGGDGKVDKAADEFISRFYKDLKSQKISMSGFESPAHNTWDRR